MPDLLWPIILLAVIMAAIRQVSRSPTIKGILGEWMVDRLLRQGLPESHYTVLRDITLPSRDGTTQIDHVVISRHGIFVIETKHLSGWIFGSERDATWTQTFHRARSIFQNPLRQNFAHVKALEDLLNLPSTVFRSIVVLTGTAKFKTQLPSEVMKLEGLLDFIQSVTETVIPAERVSELVATIESSRLKPGRKSRAAHVALLKARHGAAKGLVDETRGLIRQATLTVLGIKAAIGITVFGLMLVVASQVFSKLNDVLRPPSTATIQSTPTATTTLDPPKSSQPPATPSGSATPLTQSLFPNTHAALKQLQENTRAREEKREAQRRLVWESELLCAYSSDTGRCACYEPKGPKADVSHDLCMSLANK